MRKSRTLNLGTGSFVLLGFAALFFACDNFLFYALLSWTSPMYRELRSSSAVAGLVLVRQRPGTAKGTMFLLFEDEFGTVNLVVPKAVYERHRYLARAEPLLLARGRVERAEGVVNLIVRELAALEQYVSGGVEGDGRDATGAPVHHLPVAERAQAAEEDDAIEVGSSMRAVAPPIQSFAMGRRR